MSIVKEESGQNTNEIKLTQVNQETVMVKVAAEVADKVEKKELGPPDKVKEDADMVEKVGGKMEKKALLGPLDKAKEDADMVEENALFDKPPAKKQNFNPLPENSTDEAKNNVLFVKPAQNTQSFFYNAEKKVVSDLPDKTQDNKEAAISTWSPTTP